MTSVFGVTARMSSTNPKRCPIDRKRRSRMESTEFVLDDEVKQSNRRAPKNAHAVTIDSFTRVVKREKSKISRNQSA
jgi:hypothetical protein